MQHGGKIDKRVAKTKKAKDKRSYTITLSARDEKMLLRYCAANKISQKVGEEALETVIEATNGTDEHLVYEASDLLYHLLVMLTAKGLRIEDVAAELQKRHDPNWDKKRRQEKAKGTMK